MKTMTRKRPLTPTALALVMLQEFKLERLRELHHLQTGANNSERVLLLQCEMEALELLEHAFGSPRISA